MDSSFNHKGRYQLHQVTIRFNELYDVFLLIVSFFQPMMAALYSTLAHCMFGSSKQVNWGKSKIKNCCSCSFYSTKHRQPATSEQQWPTHLAAIEPHISLRSWTVQKRRARKHNSQLSLMFPRFVSCVSWQVHHIPHQVLLELSVWCISWVFSGQEVKTSPFLCLLFKIKHLFILHHKSLFQSFSWTWSFSRVVGGLSFWESFYRK